MIKMDLGPVFPPHPKQQLLISRVSEKPETRGPDQGMEELKRPVGLWSGPVGSAAQAGGLRGGVEASAAPKRKWTTRPLLC